MKYRKKPVVIEAWQWNGDMDSLIVAPRWVRDAVQNDFEDGQKRFYIETLEGEMYISQGDYIIQGVAGEVYPCKPDIFNSCYEAV